jgi:hypothetical protein
MTLKGRAAIGAGLIFLLFLLRPAPLRAPHGAGAATGCTSNAATDRSGRLRSTVFAEARRIMRSMMLNASYTYTGPKMRPPPPPPPPPPLPASLHRINYTLFRRPRKSSLSSTRCVLSSAYSSQSDSDNVAQSELVGSLRDAIGEKFHVVLGGGSLIHAVRFGTAEPKELRLHLVPRKSLPGVLDDAAERRFTTRHTALIEKGIKEALWTGGFKAGQTFQTTPGWYAEGFWSPDGKTPDGKKKKRISVEIHFLVHDHAFSVVRYPAIRGVRNWTPRHIDARFFFPTQPCLLGSTSPVARCPNDPVRSLFEYSDVHSGGASCVLLFSSFLLQKSTSGEYEATKHDNNVRSVFQLDNMRVNEKILWQKNVLAQSQSGSMEELFACAWSMSKAGVDANLLSVFNPLTSPLQCKYVSALKFEENGDSVWNMDFLKHPENTDTTTTNIYNF